MTKTKETTLSVGSKVFRPDGLQRDEGQQPGNSQMTDGKHMQISGRQIDDNRHTDDMTRPRNVTWADRVRNGKYQVKGMTVKQ